MTYSVYFKARDWRARAFGPGSLSGCPAFTSPRNGVGNRQPLLLPAAKLPPRLVSTTHISSVKMGASKEYSYEDVAKVGLMI
jgi:hypothetical protein